MQQDSENPKTQPDNDADDAATADEAPAVEVETSTTVEDKRLGGPREGGGVRWVSAPSRRSSDSPRRADRRGGPVSWPSPPAPSSRTLIAGLDTPRLDRRLLLLFVPPIVLGVAEVPDPARPRSRRLRLGPSAPAALDAPPASPRPTGPGLFG